MNLAKKALVALSITGAFAGYANAQTDYPNSESITRMLKQSLETDRKGVEMGFLPPSILKIDEELLRTPANSPKARQLHAQYVALMRADRSKAHKELEASEAKRAMHPSTGSPSQPQGQQQRMCSVNNGSSTSLVPC